MKALSHACCVLWSTSLILPCMGSAVPVAFATARLPFGDLKGRHTWRPLVTMQSQGTAVSVEPTANAQQSVEPVKRRPIHSFPKKPRVLKTVSPFSRSLEDAQYLAGMFAFVGRHTAGKAAGTALKDGINPFALLMSSIYVPRVMSLVGSPFPITVEEGIEMVSKDEQSGAYELNRLNSSKAGAERMAFLILEDLDNIRNGVYPMPSELRIENQVSAAVVEETLASFAFASKAYMPGAAQSVSPGSRSPELVRLAAGLDLPAYYLHDFHSLPGGFLNREHVRVYDALSESVFVGAHRLGRRMMLRPIHARIKASAPHSRAGNGLKLLDIGTGTASFLIQAQEAFPALELHGIDLSPAMIDFARETVPAHPSVQRATAPLPKLTRASMEQIPAEDESFEFVTHSNCFHELPEEAIRRASAEVVRVLKPGGLFVHMDAVQMRDDASIATSSRVHFDGKFTEPYMRAWMDTVDLDEIVTSAGMMITAPPQPYFVSTLRVYQKPL